MPSIKPHSGEFPISTARKRPGFTLVEMLVTFSIIAVLGSLIAAGIMSWMGSQARRNSETTIRTLHSAVMQHWETIVSEAKNDNLSLDTDFAALKAFADNDPAKARVIWIKLRLMEAFPVNFREIAEAYTAEPLTKIPAKKRRYMASYKSSLPAGYTAAAPGKTESAACLRMALNINRGGVGHSQETLKPFSRDTNNDKVEEFVDGWGEPLAFYRFAMNCAELQQGAASVLSSSVPTVSGGKCYDPIDPKGLLLSWTTGTFANFDSKIHARKSGSDALYAVPVIVSSGPDVTLGLSANTSPPYQDMTISSAKQADDNIYSFKLK